MPVYEYVCIGCGEKAEVWATIAEKEKGLKVTCPKCGSSKMAQVFGSFAVVGSSGGRSGPPICGPSAEPGCCGERQAIVNYRLSRTFSGYFVP